MVWYCEGHPDSVSLYGGERRCGFKSSLVEVRTVGRGEPRCYIMYHLVHYSNAILIGIY